MRRSLALGPAAVAVAALLTGCGSGSSSSSSSAAATTPATTATQSSTATAAAGTGVTVDTKKNAKLGTILAAGPKRLTVYLFEKDKGTTSMCEGECAKDWPPVTTDGAPVAAGGALSAELGTTKRPDGTEQVTYKGHPLYFFEQDKDAEDAYGQDLKAFGASWYVLEPSGNKLEDSSEHKGGDHS